MGYVTLGPATSSGTILKSWGDQVNLNFEAVKGRVMPVYRKNFAGAATPDTYLGGQYGDLIGSSVDLGNVNYGIFVPPDYGSITKAKLRVHNSIGAGNLYYETFAYWGAPGQGLNAGGSSYTATAPLAISSGIITEIDVSNVLAGLTANVSLTFSFNRLASSSNDTLDNTFAVLGAFFEYTPAT